MHNLAGVKLQTRSRIGFSHLSEHKFRHNIHDAQILYALVSNFTLSFALPQLFLAPSVPMNDLDLMYSSIYQLSETDLANKLLYDDSRISTSKNNQIFQSTMKYIFARKRFE